MKLGFAQLFQPSKNQSEKREQEKEKKKQQQMPTRSAGTDVRV